MKGTSVRRLVGNGNDEGMKKGKLIGAMTNTSRAEEERSGRHAMRAVLPDRGHGVTHTEVTASEEGGPCRWPSGRCADRAR